MRYSRILLIDDDEDDQELFAEAIGQVAASVQCTVLESAQDALRMLESGEIAVDLIFLDLNMPVMSGQQFLAEKNQRAGLRDIPVIVLSTSSNADIIAKTTALGVRKFVTKPNSFTELKTILFNILK
jgi:CheY-like chemotaxis protein